jgi:CRISPR-associated endonuclease/helicase Cas3
MPADPPPLSVGDFPAFFSEVLQFAYGSPRKVGPFPWQSRLVEQVASEGRWPQLLPLPTGSGKTTVLLIATFLLAVGPEVAPRRIVMVVDRRVVVDQSYELAVSLAQAVNVASSGVLAVVRSRLEALSGGEAAPLVAARLRGGVPRNNDWAVRPDQPAVICSTVDQVGSRLLFQGYGVRERMRSVHAGLLGQDSLIFLDEVHLSQAFSQTLSTVGKLHASQGSLLSPWGHVLLSATPRERDNGTARSFALWAPGERQLAAAAPLVQCLGAAKLAELKEVKVDGAKGGPSGGRSRLAVATKVKDEVCRLLKDPAVRALGVVVNRVDTARDVRRLLERATDDVDVVLLTGRARPVERDRLVEPLKVRLGAGRSRGPGEPRTIVVSTQCIEAGADYDFDALVTECASLDALRQRFGRVDRRGKLSKAGTPSRSVVLKPPEPKKDPVYGDAIYHTWTLLSGMKKGKVVDFGVDELDRRLGDAVTKAAKEELVKRGKRPARDQGPPGAEELAKEEMAVLQRALSPMRGCPRVLVEMDAWAERPIGPGRYVPGVERFLHGDGAGAADVQVVWRCDITEAILEDAVPEKDSDEGAPATSYLRSIIGLCPPRSAEAVSISVLAARQWLADQPGAGLSDVEGVPAGEKVESGERGNLTTGYAPLPLRPFVVWQGDSTFVGNKAAELAPGATVVVPSSYGGMRADVFSGVPYGFWDPSCTDNVADVAEEARDVSQMGRWLRRLVPALLGGTPAPQGGLDDEAAAEVVKGWRREEGQEKTWPAANYTAREVVADKAEWAPAGCRGGLWYVVLGRFKRPSKQVAISDLEDSADGETTTDPETSSLTGQRALLCSHLRGVGSLARAFAVNCFLSESLASDLELAGLLHDVGKVDRRFQAWLRDGRPMLAGDPYLAKSGIPAWDRWAWRKARLRAGYPDGARHEALSTLMLTTVPELAAKAHDWDLVQHLVASHHGWARPFLPAAFDNDAGEPVELEHLGAKFVATTDYGLCDVASGVAERFWSLVARYGHHQLAYLEALLRLADNVQSEREKEGPGAQEGQG